MKENLAKTFLDDLHGLPEFADFKEITVNTKSSLGDTPLHVAAIRGDISALQALLDVGADVNAQGEHQYTPLHEAVEQGHVKAVRTLLAANARKDLTNDDGVTPLALAELLDETEIAELLR